MTVSLSKMKAGMSVLFIIGITSLSLVVLDESIPTKADPILDMGEFLTEFIQYADNIEYDTPGTPETIILKPLARNETVELDFQGVQLNGSSVYGTDPIFLVTSANQGTYKISNIDIVFGRDTDFLIEEGTGTVILDNVNFGSQGYRHVESGSKELIMNNCLFGGSYGENLLIKSGKASIFNTVFRPNSDVQIESSDKVHIENCFFEGASIDIKSTDTVDLEVRNCTFLAESYSGSINMIEPASMGNNSIKVIGSLFKGVGSEGIAIVIRGDHNGVIEIDNCQFSQIIGSAPKVDLECNMYLTLSNTTFSHCETTGGMPIVSVIGMRGDIFNSTFTQNSVGDSSLIVKGCLKVVDSVIDIKFSTFLDNYFVDISSVYSPASLEIVKDQLETKVFSVNNIFLCVFGQEGDPTIITSEAGLFSDNGGTIDKVMNDSSSILGVIFPIYDVLTGCDIMDMYPTECMMVVPIVPFGDADGKGVSVSGITFDQRGRERSGNPDIGAVSIKTVQFNANGGELDIPYGSGFTLESQYYMGPGFTDVAWSWAMVEEIVYPETEFVELKLAPPLSSDIIPPISKRLLGWSKDPSADLPDPGYVDLGDVYLDDFEVDEEYYAVWGEGNLAVLEPGNGVSRSLSMIQSNGTVKFPSLGTVDGMSISKWTTDISGDTQWDPAVPVTSNIVLYGQWDYVTLSVTFEPENGNDPSTSYLTYGNRISAPLEPLLEGYDFKGWYSQKSGGELWDFNTLIIEDIVLYGQWEEIVIPPVPPGPDDEDDEDDEDEKKTPFESSDAVTVVAATAASVLASVGIAAVAVNSSAVAGGMPQTIMGDSMGAETSGEEKNRRSVIFYPRNGRSEWTSNVFSGRQVDRPSDPIPPEGKVFVGWSTTPNGTTLFNFMTSITQVTHLYAVYEDDPKQK